MEPHQKSDVNPRVTLALIGLVLLSMNSLILPFIEDALGYSFSSQQASMRNAFNPIGWFFISLCICWSFFTKYLAGNLLSQTLTISLAVASLYIGNKDDASEKEYPPIDLSEESIERIDNSIANAFGENHITLLQAQHEELLSSLKPLNELRIIKSSSEKTSQLVNNIQQKMQPEISISMDTTWLKEYVDAVQQFELRSEFITCKLNQSTHTLLKR